MTAVAEGPQAPSSAAAPSPADLARLEESFRTFNRVTRDLESAYRNLQGRAERMDARLHEANRRLSQKVSELRRTASRLQAVLDAVPCGVVTCAADGTITGVNRAAERILGRAAAELTGRDARTLRGKEGSPLLLLGAEDAPSAAERDGGSLDGARRRTASSVTDLPDGERLEIIADLTEIAHLRTQLNRLDTLAALGEMAGAVAHEIRNPLNGVQGFAALLTQALAGDAPPDREKLRRYSDLVRVGAAEVNEIISNLLLWARPERLDRSEFPLRGLVEEAVAFSRHATAAALADEAAAQEKGAPSAARVEIDGGAADVRLRADRVKLKIVLGNLIRNAAEAAGPGGRVRVTPARDPSGVAVIVDDDGPGVSEEMRRRLFRPFSTDKPSGTGLGLAVAKKLTEVHGGELRLTRGPWRGARFVVTLPERVIAEAAS